jgi:hypothetical protein
MLRIFHGLKVASLDSLGRCMFCIRTALLSAVGAWLLVIMVYGVSGSNSKDECNQGVVASCNCGVVGNSCRCVPGSG